ncbi:unnamed protein product [Psylliodes chrysocephalus]|uniref:Uncharacterized protein n=1 Tax=Psylliodes chrysocephalus TaxID=3402493 RepID=A0A9P0D5Y3_9CUCU|nr:unnamed protein product [Psylliodes chrysocephala]
MARAKKNNIQNQRSKECMRKLRQRIKNDPILYEEQKQYTPPGTPILFDHGRDVAGPSRQSVSGKRIQRRNRDELKKKIKVLEEKLRKSDKRVRKYKKRLSRKAKQDPDTPKKKVKKMLFKQQVTPEVKRNLLAGEALKEQIKINFKEQKKGVEKRNVLNNITGKVIKKYKFKNLLGQITSRRGMDSRRASNERKAVLFKIKQKIQTFFEVGKISRMCPGKKDTITFRKAKKQKRYLNDSLKNIYEDFKKTYPRITISYSSFCKLRPFWVVFPTAQKRETCLCILHDNFELLTTKLKSSKILVSGMPTNVIKEICCDVRNENYLLRVCKDCLGNEIKILDFNKEEVISYEKWITKKVEISIKGETKMCQKTIKEKVECKKEEAVNHFKKLVPSFLKHTQNIVHQYHAIDVIKKQLAVDEVLIHIDFSENYGCKYGKEIQSAHFGGSKQQISMHTVIIYYKKKNAPDMKNVSLCTMSENLRHDPSAICAHLQPVFDEVQHLVPNLRTINFLSDGPSTQYRNKKMFFFMAKYISNAVGAEQLRWHYSEPGHGKGAPDGVGGCLKKMADRLVSHGKDIPNFDIFLKELTENCRGIKCIPIASQRISEMNSLLPENFKPFKGTMAIRELAWHKHKPDIMYARTLTCVGCNVNIECPHYGLGITITICSR